MNSRVLLQKTMHLLMAVLVLSSTNSLIFNKHICMGRVTNVGLFIDSGTCGMVEVSPEAERYRSAEKAAFSPIKCCTSESSEVTGQHELDSFFQLTLAVPVFIPYPVIELSSLQGLTACQVTRSDNLARPPKPSDIPLVLHRLLI